MSNKNLRRVRLFLQALSNDTRLAILDLLREQRMNVTEIAGSLGFDQSRVSHNLRCLLNCGFLKVEREGRQRIYELDSETTVPILDAIDRHVSRHGEKLEGCETLNDVRLLTT